MVHSDKSMMFSKGEMFNNSVLLFLHRLTTHFSTASRRESSSCEGEINRRRENLAFLGTVSRKPSRI